MNRKSILLLASVILLVSATVIGSIGPVHAQTAYTFVNKFVPPQGVVDINGRRPTCPTSGSFCDLGIPNGGSSFGDLSLIDQVNGTANTFSFKYTLNVTGPSLPVATFTNNGTLTEPASSCALSSCYDRLTHLTAINTTMTISVASAVPHGSYLLNVTAQNGDPTQNKFLLFRIKVYSIAISIDAQSTAATDTTASITAAPLLTFRVGFLVTNATNSKAAGRPACTTAFPCGLPVYGWEFTLIFDPTVLVPQGDPNPLATPGNLGGLYVDGAQSIVVYGGQNIGLGAGTTWQTLLSGSSAFAAEDLTKVGKVSEGITLKAPQATAYLTSATGGFQLGSVSFELIKKANTVVTLSTDPAETAFVDQLAHSACTCVIGTLVTQGTTATENIGNAPPTASFTVTPIPAGDASCTTIYSVDTAGCSSYAFTFDASGSSDPEASALTYVWDFGDGSRDSAAELTGGCPPPDADLSTCAQGVTVIHDFGAVAALGGSAVPGKPTVTLRVTDASGATGSARTNGGNPISNAQPSHMFQAVFADLAPTAAFTFSPSTPSPGQTVTFDATGSTDSDGTVATYFWNFGDGFGASVGTATTTHAFACSTPPCTFTVGLVVQDNTGLNSTLTTHSITVGVVSFTSSFTATPSNPNQGQLVTFNGSTSGGTGPTFTYHWTFGDGGTATTTTTTTTSSTTHTYATKGSFSATLSVTDSAAATATATPQTVTVAGVAPTVSFTVSASPTVGSPVTFTATVTSGTGPYSFSWNFGDGSALGTTNPVSHTYATKGAKTVTLTVTDANAKSTPSTQTVNVAPLPLSASFTVTASPTVGSPVTFTATVTGGTTPYTFSWNFGDGSAAGTTNPVSHTYAAKGSKTVTVTVTDVNLATTTSSQSVSVAPIALAASFTVSASPTVGSPVTFTATVTGGTTPYTFSWNFGDGSALGTTNPVSHTYATKGAKTVTLTVTDGNAATTTSSQSVNIIGTPPTVSFTVSANPTVGSPVTFTATVTGGTTPYTFSWSFGDGSALGTTNPVSHTYATKGTKTVQLNVTDANTAKVITTQTITVAPIALAASFTVSASPTVGSPVTLTATVTGGTTPYTFSWNFGDGSALGTTNPVSHTYSTKGTKTVQLNVTDANLVKVTTSQTISVAPLALAASFTVSASPTVGSPVTFTATVTGGTTPYTFSWSFGDGSALGTTNPVSHTYSTKGTKTVQLNVTDANLVKVTTTQTISVAPLALAASFTVSASPTVGSPVTFTATVTGGTTPYTFSWSFGDGSAKGTTNPVSHTYSTKGTKTVQLNVTDTNAVKVTTTQTINVAGTPPTVSFTVSANPTVGSPVTFTATVTGGTAPYSFSWNFGDGSALGTTNPVSHTYATKGSKTVTLTVTDGNAATTTSSQSVSVAPLALAASFTVSASPTVGSPVTFTATVTGGTTPYTFSWNFGDGSALGTTNPVSHTYTTKGSKTVTLTVTDGNAATTTSSQTVSVAPLALAASFTVSASPTVGSPVTFTATVTGGTTPYTFSWNFGDGSALGTTNPVSHTYTTKGAKTVTLTVTDGNAATTTSSQTVNVAGTPPTVSFTVSANPTVGSPVTFTATVTGGTTPYTFSWNFGDGSALGTTNPVSHTYSTKGTKTVQLNVTDANTAKVITTQTISVAPLALAASFTVSASPTVGSPVTFTATVTGGTTPYTFSWNFGDGSALGTTNPVSHTYTTKGAKTVTLTVTDGNAATTTSSQTINVAGTPPTVSFTVSASPTVGSPVTFTATVTGGTAPYSFSWNFGDGSAVGTTNPVSHTYSTKGSKIVTLTVTDANTATATSSQTINVAGTPPTVTFTVSASPTAGSPVTFTATVTGGTPPYSFSWNFGDGSGAGTTNPVSHTYATKGSKTVTVTVTDANAAQGTSSQTISVAAAALAASFTVSANPVAGSPVTFTATVTGGTTPYTFSWNFGDGSALGTTNPVSHTYTTKGSKTVTLTVTDGNAATTTSTQSVQIGAGTPPTVTFTVSANPTVGSPVTFTATATGGTSPYSFSWNFGDGSAAGTTNPVSHTYSTKGSKTVTVTVTDANTATGTSSQTINVAGLALSASFTISASPTAGKPVTFTATVSGGTTPYSFSWNFGDGSAAGTGNPATHSYTVKGTRTVTLTVTDTNGASTTSSQSVTVTPQPLTVSFTASSGCQTVTFTASVTGGTSPYSYSWNFGDGSFGTGNPVTHTYATKGTKTVTVTVTDGNANTATASQTLASCSSVLTASFAVSANPTVGSPVTFTATVTGGTAPYTFSWSFGDGSAKGTTNPVSHTYSTKGTKTVQLNVTDANSAKVITTQTVSVAGTALSATFTVSSGPTVGSPVTFTATVTGGTAPYSFSWNFGDGSAVGTTNPVSHTYSTKGSKTVTLTVTDANTATTTSSQTITVAGTPLTTSFTVSSNPTTGNPVTFTATVSGGTPPYTFSWNFGDGSALGTTNPVSHTYGSKGSFTVTLTVTDTNGAMVQSNQMVNVAGTPIAASFTSTPAAPMVGQSITFTATVSGGTPPYTFSWNFGDGSVIALGNPTTHSYATKGSFTVTLTVTDANSANVQVIHTVTVTPNPLVVTFASSPSPILTGQPTTFTATVSGGTGPYSFAWAFGDAATGTGNPISHNYSSATIFTVTVTVTDANGAKATASQAITVFTQFSVPAGTSTVDATGVAPLTIDFNTPTPMVVCVSNIGMDTAGPVPGGLSFLGTFLQVTDCGTGATGFTATLHVMYTDAQVSAAGIDASTLRLYTSEGSMWTLIPGSTVDTVNRIVSGTVNHFSFFAPIGAPSVTCVPVTPGTQCPVAAFVVSPVAPGTTIGVGVPIKFDAKDSFDPNPGGTITNYAWNFGDGSTTNGTTAKTTHTYTLNGTYTVTLTVTDNFGNTGTVSHKVNVIPAPIIDTGNFRFKRNLNQGNVGLTQTWIIGVINPNAFPIDINMVISGSIDTAGAFSVQSGPVLIQPGAEVFITLTNTFNNADKGSTVNFQVAVYFTTNTVNPGPVSGFTLGPVITDSFRIRP